MEVQFEEDWTNHIILDLDKHGANSVDILNEINNRITETILHLGPKKSINELRSIRKEYDYIVGDEMRKNIENLFDEQIAKILKILVVNRVPENKDVYYCGLLEKKGSFFPYNYSTRYVEIYMDGTFKYFVNSKKVQYRGEGSFACELEIIDTGEKSGNVKTSIRMWEFEFPS